jgi:hypothetical protein
MEVDDGTTTRFSSSRKMSAVRKGSFLGPDPNTGGQMALYKLLGRDVARKRFHVQIDE